MLTTEFRPKVKTCAYEKCGREFLPVRPMQQVCGPLCAGRLVKARALERKRQEQAETRARKDAIKRIAVLESECRDIVQEIARIRDRDDGCISCHVGPNYDGIWHGSHYRSHGGCSSLQFHLWNIHKSCEQCNFFKGGNVAEYHPRLVEKIGADRVDWLDDQPKSRKFSREYLLRFKQVMGKRLRRMKKRIA